MAGHECYHCKQWVEEGADHDCWTTTEAALTRDLTEDLRDAWERVRETAAEFGEQRIYASHNSIMFARKSCYFFVRPKRTFLEVCVFLARPVNAPQVRRVVAASKTKLAHLIQVRHRDEVEAPLTDWLQEAYDFAGAQMTKPAAESSSAKAGARATAKAGTRATAKSRGRSAAKPGARARAKSGARVAAPAARSAGRRKARTQSTSKRR